MRSAGTSFSCNLSLSLQTRNSPTSPLLYVSLELIRFLLTWRKWSNIEQTAKSSIQEKKIRVIFLPADDTTETPRSNGATQNRESLHPSPSPEAVTPQRGSTEQPVGSVSRPESRPTESKNLGEIRREVHNPATASGQASGVAASISAAAAGVANAIPKSSAELEAQLNDAKATISNLTQQLEKSSGLRQRKAEPARDSREQLQTAASTQQAPGGVPIHIAALLSLLSFLLAYFLF